MAAVKMLLCPNSFLARLVVFSLHLLKLIISGAIADTKLHINRLACHIVYLRGTLQFSRFHSQNETFDIILGTEDRTTCKMLEFGHIV
jgi:hypothetical protein